MAGNIAGMFQQMNQAIQGQQGQGQGMLNMASQGLGNAAAAGVNAMRGPESEAPQAQGMDFMNEPAKAMEIEDQSRKIMAEAVTSEDPEALKQAAQQLMSMGKTAEAEQLMKKISAIQAKQNAMLDAGNLAVQEEVESKKQRRMKNQAVAYAKREGDPKKVTAIQTGAMTPEAYFATQKEKKELYELSQGEMLTDEDGNIIRLNPKLERVGGNYEASVHDAKEWDRLSTEANENKLWSAKTEGLAQQIAETDDWKSGLFATVDEYVLDKLGMRDDPQYLRTQAVGITNHEALGMLPPGPASDKDVEIVMRGVPDARTAGKEEIVEYLDATSRVSRKLAEYNSMRAAYVMRGKREDFQKDWDAKMEKEGAIETRNANIAETPPSALTALENNPEMRDDFLAKYKWLPEGM